MENNFTPVDIEKLKGGENRLNTILLLIVTITMAILAIMLFVLIQKKIKTSRQETPKMSLPTITIAPEKKEASDVEDSPTNLPSLSENETSSPSPNINLFPTESITNSSTLEATGSAR